MTIYRTKDGDTLDYICWKFYDQQSGAVEAVLEANPNLSELGPVYSAGLRITLPKLEAKNKAVEVRLWD